MNIDRRAVLRVGGYGLAASLVPLRFAQAAAEIKTLQLIDALSKSSMTWTTLDLLRPAVQRIWAARSSRRRFPAMTASMPSMPFWNPTAMRRVSSAPA